MQLKEAKFRILNQTEERMGNYLSEPVTTKIFQTGVHEADGVKGNDNGYTYACVSM